MANNKIAFLASLDFTSWEPEKVLEALSSFGYDGVGWTLSHFNPRTRTKEELKKLVKLTQGYGLEISEIMVRQDVVSLDESVRRDRIKLVKECIETASEAGIKIINLFSGAARWNPKASKIPENIPEGRAWEQILEAFQEFVEWGEKYKVHLAIEAVFGQVCHDYYTTRELIDAFDSEYMGINMDPSHYQLYGNDIPWVVKRWGEKIKHVHLKDVVGRPGIMNKDFIFPLLGEGTINWKAFFEALEDIKYKGFFSIEFESFNYYRNILRNNPVKAAEISMEQIKRLLE